MHERGEGGVRDPMSCPVDERLAAYLDGALGEAERDAIEAHAAGCDACRGALAETALALAGAADAVAPPASAVARAKAAGAPPASSSAPAPRGPSAQPARVRADRRARPPVLLRWASAAVLVIGAALAASLSRPGPDATTSLVVASVDGGMEVRRPGEET